MNRVSQVARYLLGLTFTVFGLNGFLHFIPQPPPASPLALQYLTVMGASRYIVLIFLLQLITGLLLLANRFVPLALTILAALITNILLYHITMDLGGIGAGLFVAILWILVFLSVRDNFKPLFEATPSRRPV